MENSFSCQMANCSMSFDDEEQLTAHKKKHELSLSLTPSSYKNPFILDQTPTPTQFLNPVSLELEDLQSDNPFDATFRKANSSNRASNNIVTPESSAFLASLPDSEVLNTPSIIIPSEPATPICLKPYIFKNTKKNIDNQLNENNESLPFIPTETTAESTSPQQSIEDAELPSESANYSAIQALNLDELIAKEVKKSTASKNVLQTSVITSVGNTTVLKGTAVGVPTAVVVTRAPVNSISTVTQVVGSQIVNPQGNQLKVQKTIPTVAQPLPVGTVLLSFNLADPQTILQIGSSLPATVATIAPQVTSTTSNAKMKLKEVLTQNQKSGTSVRKSNTSKSKFKPAILIHPDSSDGARMSSSPPSSPPPFSTRKSGHNGRKRGDSIADPDEKRMRSLERNRAAATRCREKRKMWIKNLEKKADELAETNVHLQNEVNLLRNEVAHLKMLLLEHKDCPVTLQQKASIHETENETYTTVRIITSTPDDVQRVPNVSVVSPHSSDFMEVEVSSVQSCSDSMASEASETSYRER